MAWNANRVALILPRGHDYSLRLVEGVLTAAGNPTQFRFIDIGYDEEGCPAELDRLAVDGALVWTHPSASWVLGLRDRGVKVVSFNVEWAAAGIPCVASDLEGETRLALEHFATLGRRHVAYVDHESSHSPTKQLSRKKFLAGSAARGWTTTALEVPGIPSAEHGRLANPADESALLAFLRDLPLPAAVYCDDDYVAALVCSVAEHLDLAVPGDLAVLGRLNMTVARFARPTISSLPGSGEAVGAAGMRLLADLLAGKAPPARPIIVASPPVVIRESTGGVSVRDSDVRRVHDLIQRFACKGLTVDQLLSRVSLSQKTLNRQYEAAYGHTPGAAIRQVRAAKAKDLLVTTNFSYARVADMCGFDEPSNFIRFFKREVGCTPGAFRKRERDRRAAGQDGPPATSARE